MALVKVQAKGQMTVPQPMREAMNIETGTELVCMQTGPGVFECRVVPKPLGVRELLDRFGMSGPGPTQEEIDADIEAGFLADIERESGGLSGSGAPSKAEAWRGA